MHKIIAQYQIALALGTAACLVANEEDSSTFKTTKSSPPEVAELTSIEDPMDGQTRTAHLEGIKQPAPIPAAPTDLVVYTDGSCHPNPGPAGCGAVMLNPDDPGFQRVKSEMLGKKTNNEAEYCGIILGLKMAIDHAAENVRMDKGRITMVEIKSDSELVVKQLNGEYDTDPKFVEFQMTISRMIVEAKASGIVDKFKFLWIPGKTNPAHDPAEKAYKECAKKLK